MRRDKNQKYVSIILILLLCICCILFFGIGTSVIAVAVLIGFLAIRWAAEKGFQFVEWCMKSLKMESGETTEVVEAEDHTATEVVEAEDHTATDKPTLSEYQVERFARECNAYTEKQERHNNE